MRRGLPIELRGSAVIVFGHNIADRLDRLDTNAIKYYLKNEEGGKTFVSHDDVAGIEVGNVLESAVNEIAIEIMGEGDKEAIADMLGSGFITDPSIVDFAFDALDIELETEQAISSFVSMVESIKRKGAEAAEVIEKTFESTRVALFPDEDEGEDIFEKFYASLGRVVRGESDMTTFFSGQQKSNNRQLEHKKTANAPQCDDEDPHYSI